MRPKLHSIALAALCGTALASPAAGWQAQPEGNVVVGPAEIRDFALPGTPPPPEPQPEATPAPTPPPVAEPTPEPVTEAPPPAEQPASPASTPPAEPPASAESPPASDEEQRPAADDETEDREAEPARTADEGGTADAVPTAQSDATAPGTEPAAEAVAAAPKTSDEGGSRWLVPLLAALAILGGAFAFYKFLRREPEAEFEPEQIVEPAPEPLPAPSPEPVAAAVAPPLPAPPSDIPAVVLRPWLELHFKPARATATDGGASIQYDAVIRNVGNAPARNVRLAARMFNSGSDVQEDVSRFYGMGIDAPDGAPLTILPRTEVSLSSVVNMAREEMREVKVQGRSLFIPTIAFNLLYDWGRDKVGQTCSAHVIGREPDPPAEKMAPFRLDLGPRVYRSVGQRPSALARAV